MGKIHNRAARKWCTVSGWGTFPCFMSSSGLCSSRTDRGTLSCPTDGPETKLQPPGESLLPSPLWETLSKLLNLMQNHQCWCNGQAVMLWLHFVRLQRQRGTSTSGWRSNFNSIWEGNTLNTSWTNTERDEWAQTPPQRDNPCSAQTWLVQGDWELASKSNLNRKVKSVQREKGWGVLPDPVGIFQAAWSWIQCLHQFSLVFVSSLKHSVWSKSYWIFTKPFLHAKAFSTLMFKKVPVAATVSSMCPYLFSL